LSASGGLASLHWIPGVHEIARLLQYANFADLLALLIEHEVPLGEGLRLAADTTADQRLQRAACRLAETVERGESTGTAILPENRDLPPFLSWVLNQGGRGSNPVRLLRHAAGFYRRRAITATNWFKVLFPLLTPLILAPTITFIYLLSLFGPLAVFWKDLGVD
jgi:type II secretory pathway component PulF